MRGACDNHEQHGYQRQQGESAYALHRRQVRASWRTSKCRWRETGRRHRRRPVWGSSVRWVSGVSLDDTTTKAWVLGWGVCVAPFPAVVLAEPCLATRLGARTIVGIGLGCPGRTCELAPLERCLLHADLLVLGTGRQQSGSCVCRSCCINARRWSKSSSEGSVLPPVAIFFFNCVSNPNASMHDPHRLRCHCIRVLCGPVSSSSMYSYMYSIARSQALMPLAPQFHGQLPRSITSFGALFFPDVVETSPFLWERQVSQRSPCTKNLPHLRTGREI